MQGVSADIGLQFNRLPELRVSLRGREQDHLVIAQDFQSERRNIFIRLQEGIDELQADKSLSPAAGGQER
jgi:hypothetical protein